jgi:hypothetical protein
MATGGVFTVLARNIRYQEDLADHLFNSTEERLASIPLLLARLQVHTSLLNAVLHD